MELRSVTNNNKYSPRFTSLASSLGKDITLNNDTILKTIEQYPQANKIAGYLPQSWVSKINASSKAEKQAIKARIFKRFREAIELLSKGKFKEAAALVSNELQNCGILPSGNRIIFKKRRANGSELKNLFVLNEYGKNTSLDRLFIKCFKDENPYSLQLDFNGLKAELSRGFYAKKRMKNNPHILKVAWGDFVGKFMVSEYVVPPKGKHNKPDEVYVLNYLKKFGVQHYDLHEENILIAQDKKGKPIWKLIDLGGLYKFYDNISKQH